MELKTSLNEYESSNNRLKVSEDLKNIEAYSYRWWQYIYTDSVGNVIFNDSNYSVSTSQHQGASENILKRLGIQVNLVIRNTCYKGSIDGLIESSIKHHERAIEQLTKAINKPRTHKRKNEERKKEIEEHQYQIKDLKNYLENYIDKKIIPISNEKPEFYYGMNTPSYYDKSDIDSLINSYAKYFKKNNGKIQVNELNQILKHVISSGQLAPMSMEKLKNLLDLKHVQIQSALAYGFINDTINMIPRENTVEYLQLVKWCKRMKITNETINMLNLDKMHTYLMNKQNRKDYVPSEPKKFPVNEKLLKINQPDLKVIKNDVELRREGKNQGHCIGSKSYINLCLSGYNACNYKGYTFLLYPHLEISQTYGKFNSETPQKIKQELMQLIAS